MNGTAISNNLLVYYVDCASFRIICFFIVKKYIVILKYSFEIKINMLQTNYGPVISLVV